MASLAGLRTIARTIGRKFGLDLTIQANNTRTGMTNGRQIYVGYGVGTPDEAKITAGIVVHEAMHCRITDFEVRANTGFKSALLNILQDVFGERIFARMYPGSPRFIREALDGMIAKGVFAEPKGDEEVPALVSGWLVDSLRSQCLGQHALQKMGEMRRALLEKHLGAPLVEEIWKTALQVQTCEDDPRALEIVEEIAALLSQAQQDAEQQPQQQPQQQQGEEGQPEDAQAGAGDGGQSDGDDQDGSGDSQQAGQPSSEGDAGEEGSSAASEPSGGEEGASQSQPSGSAPTGSSSSSPDPQALKKALEELLQADEEAFGKADLGDAMQAAVPQDPQVRRNGVGKARFERLSHDPHYMSEVRGRAAPLVNTLGARLIDLFDTQVEEGVEYRRAGNRVDVGRMPGVAVGRYDVFRHREETEGLSLAVSLAIDCSGSMKYSGIEMDRQKSPKISLMEAAQQTAMALGEVLDRAEVPFGVSLFADSVGVAKRFDESWRKARDCQIDLRHDDDTRTHEGLLLASDELVVRTEDQRLLVTITDGLPSDVKSTLVEAQELIRHGIDVVFVIINPSNQSELREFVLGLQQAGIPHSVAKTGNEIAKAVFDAVKAVA